ncbi:MAG: hypothetical protein KBG25_01185 [Paludibacteraceae bacterium]|nr:hypothetical protein [Paludibacteraceae bacterium]
MNKNKNKDNNGSHSTKLNIETGEEELMFQLNQANTKAAAFSMVVRKFQERLYWHIRKMVLSHDDANDILLKFRTLI